MASRIDGTLGSSTFGYDWASRLSSMTSPLYTGTLTFAWRLDGIMDGRQWPAGAGGAATFSYDPAKRPTAFAKAGSAASSFSQTYDRDGNVTAEGRTLTGVSGDAGTTTQSFTYDGVNRVTAASGLTNSATYAYDRDANRTSVTIGGATTTYAYDRTAELISRTDSAVTTYLTYDVYGNQTSSAPAVNLNTASTYDLADRLTSITPPASSATTFSFDALGRFLTRVTPAGSDAYEYLDTSETVWRITTGGVSTSSALDPSGARLASAKSGTTGYLLPDLHGNLAAVVNSGETAILAATRYDAFGRTAAAYDSGGAFPTPWRFQGRLDVSPDANPLYDMSARFYDPAVGAFTQLDTYAGSPGDPLSLNRYAYAEANPWTLIDPSGHVALQSSEAENMSPWDANADAAWEAVVKQHKVNFLASHTTNWYNDELSGEQHNRFLSRYGDLAWELTLDRSRNPYDNPLALELAWDMPLRAGPLHRRALWTQVQERLFDVSLEDQDAARDRHDVGNQYFYFAIVPALLGPIGDPGDFGQRTGFVGASPAGQSHGPGARRGAAPTRWQPGMPIDSVTSRGTPAAWSTVRARYWKSRAAFAGPGEFSSDQLTRMRRGLARRHETIGASMELHHLTPRRMGGTHAHENLQEVWPWVHDDLDFYRHYTGPRP